MANIISVSLSKEQKEFLDEMGLSASALLQRSINDAIDSQRISQKLVKDLQNNIMRLQETLKKYGTFIEEQHLTDSWLKYNGW